MKFSVIVPVYNVSAYLQECVDSLTAQTFDDYEIILVDDGSSDGSEMLCDGFRAAFPDRVRVIHQKNSGLGAARNKGMAAAQGEYLLFVDSDDYISRDTLRILDGAIRKTDAAMVIFGFSYVWPDHMVPGEASPLAGLPPVTLEEHPELLLHSPSTWLRVWHRSLFDNPELRFPDRVWFEDLRTTAKALTQCPGVAVIPDRLYYYRQREGSILHNENLRRNLEILDAMDDLLDYFGRHGLMDRYGAWLECLAVENMILASQRVLMRDPDADFLPEFIGYLAHRFPGYERGELLSHLGRKKRMVFWLLRKRKYRLLRSIFQLRNRMRGEK